MKTQIVDKMIEQMKQNAFVGHVGILESHKKKRHKEYLLLPIERRPIPVPKPNVQRKYSNTFNGSRIAYGDVTKCPDFPDDVNQSFNNRLLGKRP
uniref:Uncharacterized protein n=1 Tax=Ciona intestinalis TaxID=7719 RepID=H2XNL1_CIOIN